MATVHTCTRSSTGRGSTDAPRSLVLTQSASCQIHFKIVWVAERGIPGPARRAAAARLRGAAARAAGPPRAAAAPR